MRTTGERESCSSTWQDNRAPRLTVTKIEGSVDGRGANLGSRNEGADPNVKDWLPNPCLGTQVVLSRATGLQFACHHQRDTQVGGLNKRLPAVSFQLTG